MDGIAPADLYERDFYAWTQDQAARLRALGARNDGLDVENLAEEVESLGRSQQTKMRSLLARILEHLLKLRFHPDQLARKHWQKEVIAFRQALGREFEDSPSLRARRHALAAQEFRRALRGFLAGLEADGFEPRAAEAAIGDPAHPYFDLDAEVLNEAWFPDPPAA
jgi:hypothetical protein